MMTYPTGTITFLLTDIEGSTVLWEQHPEAMPTVLARHDDLIEESVIAHHGVIVRPRGEGDSRFAVFEQAGDAVRAAASIQKELAAGFSDSLFPLKVRAGLHTGAADLRMGDYYGSAVNRCARIRGLAHGGQTLLSQATAELVRDDLPDTIALVEMGIHRLKGLSRPETIFQIWLPDLPNDFPPLQSAEGFLTNLPEPPTEIIGRGRERSELVALLLDSSARLVTLTGPGGTGKTRLSLEVGRRLHSRFPDGSFFVDLAPISDAALVMTTIAHTLGIREGGGRPPFDNLKEYLIGKETLIILDNLEQVIAIAPTVAQLLAAAPKVKILATSRIPLQIRGEHEFPLATLLAPPRESLSIDELLEFEAVRLFVRQAQAARPSFELTADNAEAVAGICRRLDGLPLAIEIAAARIRLLPPPAILKRLDKSMSLLIGGAADLPTRQQTLRGAIDWSYDLLQSEEQTLFARLSVFVGGFTLENAEIIGNFDGALDVFSGIEALLRNSLVRGVDSVSDEPRFDMLQTIRDFALEKLEESGDLPNLRRRHGIYFDERAEQENRALLTKQALEVMARMEVDHDNYRAAMGWGLETPETVGITANIANSLTWFWFRRGHFHEGFAWSQRAMRATEGRKTIERALALIATSIMANWEGDLSFAVGPIEEATGLTDKIGNDSIRAYSHLVYGVVLINQGRDQPAYAHFTQSAELFDHHDMAFMKTTALIHLANVSLGLGQFEQAKKRLDQALPLAMQIGDEYQISFCLHNFGEVARAQGNYEQARDYYSRTRDYVLYSEAPSDEARLNHTFGYLALRDGDLEEAMGLFHQGLNGFRRIGMKRGITECLAGIAAVAAELGDAAWAAPLLGAAEAGIASFGAAWWPADRVEIERTRQRLRAALGDADFNRLWERGRGMSLDEALANVSTGHHFHSPQIGQG